MQGSFAFETEEIAWWHRRLVAALGPLLAEARCGPTGQFIKSLISSRTRDAVSLAAYEGIRTRWRRPSALAAASPNEVEHVIRRVTFADRKAAHLVEALHMIGSERGDHDLRFLGEWSEDRALFWLERLPGVGRKVAAATLNASTLGKRVFIVDSHVHRVLTRLGYIGEAVSPLRASEMITEAARTLDADDLLDLFGRMKLVGQTICRSDASDCMLCPLAPRCRTAAKRH